MYENEKPNVKKMGADITMPLVRKELTGLDEDIDIAAELVKELCMRLADLTSPEVGAVGVGVKLGSDMCPMANSIYSMRVKVKALGDTVQDVLDRIQV